MLPKKKAIAYSDEHKVFECMRKKIKTTILPHKASNEACKVACIEAAYPYKNDHYDI